MTDTGIRIEIKSREQVQQLEQERLEREAEQKRLDDIVEAENRRLYAIRQQEDHALRLVAIRRMYIAWQVKFKLDLEKAAFLLFADSTLDRVTIDVPLYINGYHRQTELALICPGGFDELFDYEAVAKQCVAKGLWLFSLSFNTIPDTQYDLCPAGKQPSQARMLVDGAVRSCAAMGLSESDTASVLAKATPSCSCTIL